MLGGRLRGHLERPQGEIRKYTKEESAALKFLTVLVSFVLCQVTTIGRVKSHKHSMEFLLWIFVLYNYVHSKIIVIMFSHQFEGNLLDGNIQNK